MSNVAVETWLVDAHVHIYDCFDIDLFLDSALRNFTRAAKKMAVDSDFSGVLLLSETSRDNWFSRFSAADCTGLDSPRWQIEKTQEKAVLKAELRQTTGASCIIYIIAGRQIVTAEGLELLALFTDSKFDDRLTTIETLHAVRDQGAIPVFPWAVGKWLGKRGRVLSDLIQTEAQNTLYLGDNSGRPIFWQNPSHFKQARELNIPILPGSDPLPIAGEELRVGRFGFSLRGQLSKSQPAADLKRLLQSKEATIQAYGQLESPWRFFINQVRLRQQK